MRLNNTQLLVGKYPQPGVKAQITIKNSINALIMLINQLGEFDNPPIKNVSQLSIVEAFKVQFTFFVENNKVFLQQIRDAIENVKHKEIAELDNNVRLSILIKLLLLSIALKNYDDFYREYKSTFQKYCANWDDYGRFLNEYNSFATDMITSVDKIIVNYFREDDYKLVDQAVKNKHGEFSVATSLFDDGTEKRNNIAENLNNKLRLVTCEAKIARSESTSNANRTLYHSALLRNLITVIEHAVRNKSQWKVDKCVELKVALDQGASPLDPILMEALRVAMMARPRGFCGLFGSNDKTKSGIACVDFLKDPRNPRNKDLLELIPGLDPKWEYVHLRRVVYKAIRKTKSLPDNDNIDDGMIRRLHFSKEIYHCAKGNDITLLRR